jgi:hypothetical protein
MPAPIEISAVETRPAAAVEPLKSPFITLTPLGRK